MDDRGTISIDACWMLCTTFYEGQDPFDPFDPGGGYVG